MHLRSLLAILVLGCSSPAHKASSGTPSGTGGAPGHIYDASDTTSCPAWPLEKLFPSVGPFFFGPDQGPCTNTQTDRSLTGPDNVFTLTYTYDDLGQPTKASTPTDMPSGIHIIEYTYADGRLQSDKDFAGGPQSNTTFRYGTDTAGYTTIDAAGAVSNFDYTLDAQGYPQTVTYSKIMDGNLVDLTGIPVHFEFEYTNCRIQKRLAYLIDFTEVTASNAQYTYDDVGHLIDIKSSTTENAYDYACWAETDASTPDGG